MLPLKNIVLIGYRGTGKTSTGRILAKRLGFTFVDTDDEVEARAGRSIAAVFAEQGEQAFRELEASVIREICCGEHQVLSLGGGAILLPENRHGMRQAGIVVWLTASVSTISQRIGADPASQGRRPNLTQLSSRGEIEAVLEHRVPIYAALADVTVATDDLTPTSVAEVILRRIQDATSAAIQRNDGSRPT